MPGAGKYEHAREWQRVTKYWCQLIEYWDESSYLMSEVRGGGWKEQPHIQGAVAAQAQEGQKELLQVKGQEGQPRPR